MAKVVRVDLDGKSYAWTGRDWYDAETYLTPPSTVVRKLNTCLGRELEKVDATTSNVGVLILRAREARDALQWDRAEALARRALRLSPGNLRALTVLCSALRARGQPQRALDETHVPWSRADGPLLTSRAAALCDVRRWQEAKREIGRALAMGSSEQAFGVVRRIKAARPGLY